MDTIRRFFILFSIFFISVIVLVVIYVTYFQQDVFEILTPVGIIIVLLLIVLCNLTDYLMNKKEKDLGEMDALPTSNEPFFDTN